MKTRALVSLTLCTGLFVAASAVPASASHSWGNYHWARSSNPFSLSLGDNVSAEWDAYLAEASDDWSVSSVLETTVVPGTAGNTKRCKASQGMVEVCSDAYGFNGWLGVAGISVSGGHITSAYVKVNDSYFGTATYNKPEWRRLVMCQEVGHAFGLDHQDENFNNANLGTCMDYSGNPLGPPSNEHPNLHDYEQLDAIYAHSDSSGGGGGKPPGRGNNRENGRSRVDHVDGRGNGTVTYIFWAA